MWQVLLLSYEQLHLIPGLLSSLSNGVSSVADPLHGSPLMFHEAAALTSHARKIEFRALSVFLKHYFQ